MQGLVKGTTVFINQYEKNSGASLVSIHYHE